MRRSRPALLGFILLGSVGGILVVVSRCGTDPPASPPPNRSKTDLAPERSEKGLREGDPWPGEVKDAALVVLFATEDKASEAEFARWKDLDRAARERGYVPRGGLLDRDPRAAALRLRMWDVELTCGPCTESTRERLLGRERILPTVFLVGADGKIRARFSGTGSFAAAILRLSGG